MTTPSPATDAPVEYPCPRCGYKTQFAYAIDGPGTAPGRICISGICSWRGRPPAPAALSGTPGLAQEVQRLLDGVAGEWLGVGHPKMVEALRLALSAEEERRARLLDALRDLRERMLARWDIRDETGWHRVVALIAELESFR